MTETPQSHFANHTLYAEEDPSAPSGNSYGLSCLYSECYGIDCLGVELADELNSQAITVQEGDVYIGAYSTGGDYYGEHDYEVFWEYAPRDPEFDERAEALAWDRKNADSTNPKEFVYLRAGAEYHE